MQKDFVSLNKLCPTIIVRADYSGSDNFVGHSIPGYNSKNALLVDSAADVLIKVADYFKNLGYGICVFDAYRPKKAVNFFGEWVESDTPGNKEKFFPQLTKRQLIEECFISLQSSHSRGSTIDLTLYDLTNGEHLDMGTIFDYFGESSYTNSDKISKVAQENRRLLLKGMEKFNFKNYIKEWWHFRLENEKYPDTFFDFDID